ncbi:MAG: hypothetical protein QXF82_10935, partial [Nitrososphaeria archaeon]
MNKIKTTIILALLLTTIFTPLITLIPVAQASTGWIRVSTPNVQAGATVLLNFTEVTWSGTQFLLFWGTDGFSQINSTVDTRMITQPISVSLFSQPYPCEVEVKANSYFYTTGTITVKIGTDGTYKLLEIPIPEKNTAGGAHFIKAFDGTAAQVAVSEEINVLPTLKLSPESGPGGCLVTLEGIALEANKLVNITYTTANKAFKQITTNNIGYFKCSWYIKDLGIEFFGEEELAYWALPVDVSVFYNETGDLVGTVQFTEFPRALYQVYDVESDWPDCGFGNKTVEVSVPILKKVVVAGNYFNPTDNVTIIFDPSGVNKFLVEVPVNASGFFNTTFTVPIVALDKYEVAIFNGEYSWVFYLEVLPSIVLTPEEGPVGTLVKVQGYGFPYISNKFINVTISWEGYKDFDVAWAKTESNGQFVAQFTVPHDYGGEHTVTAIANDTAGTWAEATFTILARLRVVPSEFANDGRIVKVIGDGLEIWDEWTGYRKTYCIAIDNQFMGASGSMYRDFGGVSANETGDLVFEIFAAGFAPGKHVVALYGDSRGLYVHGEIKSYSPNAYAYFTVTGVSPDTQIILNQLNETQTTLLTQLNTLSNKIDTLTNSVNDVKNVLTTGVQNI